MPKTILITGANGNLGVATVKKFLAAGYKVIGVDQSGTHLGSVADHDNFELKSVDAENEEAVAAFLEEAIELNGRIDAAALLVGGFEMGDIHAATGQQLRKLYALNFETAYFFARPLFEHMLGNGYGRLIFMGARLALRPEQGKVALGYALSKNLLFELAQVLNASAKGKNVVASMVAPSTIDTPINRQAIPDADPTTWVKADDIATLLEFICSEKGDTLREPVYKIYNNA